MLARRGKYTTVINLDSRRLPLDHYADSNDLVRFEVAKRLCSYLPAHDLIVTAYGGQGYEEALNLVHVHQSTSISAKESPGSAETSAPHAAYDEKSKNSPDLRRAKDLVELHYRVKLKHQEEGLDLELQQARKDVNRVYMDLSRQSPM